MYDVIIIGMGIGGITAAIYARRSNLKVLILEKNMPGGLLNNIEKIENYPGLIDINGFQFAKNLFDQVKHLNIPYKLTEVKEITIDNEDVKIVKTTNEEYQTKNIIMATGRKPRFLGLEEEQHFLGRGLSTCVVCDGYLFKNKDVAVVGAGNSALQESLYLANIANKVYLLNRKDTFNKADKVLIEKVLQEKRIEIIKNVNVKKILEKDQKMSGLILDNNQLLNVEGLFLYIGFLPNSELVQKFNVVDNSGYILVNENCETKIKGLYAIGDVIKKDIYQLISATNDGIKAIYDLK
ncbi:MAG: FAD-binding protein [Firmicutes bacterium]|nr:FAD-binding protein [Bacillota bacterium]